MIFEKYVEQVHAIVLPFWQFATEKLASEIWQVLRAGWQEIHPYLFQPQCKHIKYIHCKMHSSKHFLQAKAIAYSYQ